MKLVERYLQKAGNFRNIRSLDRSPRLPFSDPLYAVIGERTAPHTAEREQVNFATFG